MAASGRGLEGGMAGGLAVRVRTTLETVQEALGALVARYRADEVLTAVRHIPAREAQFRAMPRMGARGVGGGLSREGD